MRRRYAVLGTGALGGFYGGCLAKAGFEVHFLMRSDAAAARERGLLVDSASHGRFRVEPAHVYEDPADLPDCDVALVCFKSTSNDRFGELLPAAVREGTTAVVMQNGLGVEAQAAAVIGAERLLGALCFLCSTKTGPAEIHHLDYGDIRLGRYRADGSAGGVDEEMRGIAADFEAAGITANLVEDLTLARWQKLVWNVPYNGLSVVMRATTDRLMGHPAMRGAVASLMDEVAAAAHAASGRVIERSFIEEMLDRTDRMRPYRPSMLVDFEAGRPLEVGAIFEAPLAEAVAAGCDTAGLALLTAQLRLIADGMRIGAS
ncbi:putative 2-dehydropantoate 2-reductase [Mucisphaera sp.]|uniref:putative 2-dehydropantoate 2-reductase n=1 Tax=Mucisphaera sp. TaxID=2913024 RepID=UPI003D12C866